MEERSEITETVKHLGVASVGGRGEEVEHGGFVGQWKYSV